MDVEKELETFDSLPMQSRRTVFVVPMATLPKESTLNCA